MAVSLEVYNHLAYYSRYGNTQLVKLQLISLNLPPINLPPRLWLSCNNYVTTWSHSCYNLATTMEVDNPGSQIK